MLICSSASASPAEPTGWSVWRGPLPVPRAKGLHALAKALVLGNGRGKADQVVVKIADDQTTLAWFELARGTSTATLAHGDVGVS